MAQVILANQKMPTTGPSNSDAFFGFWVLTRALLAAGYKYKACGDATATGVKDTTGNFLLEKWGVGGGVVLNANVQTGTSSDTMTANTDGTVTHVITGATFSATLSVGRYLTISGAVNASNNGTFRIVAYTSATTVKVFNPASTTETTTITWTEKHGGANGSITAAGTGGATPGRAIFSVSSGTPFVAPVAFPVNRGSVGDRLTIIGATTGANNGTFMITRVISTTSVEIDNSAATTDAGNGTLSWAECSPTQQTYPTSITGATGVGAWLNLQGPSTLKIPIGTNVPSTAFFRGELVTQTTSGATGTILGCLTDTSGGLGFLVVEPRLNGTGGGVRGWTTGGTDTVSAASAPTGSGATITSSATAPIEYVREFVIWKAAALTGHMWTQTVDQSAESASRFSVLATGGSVSNTVAPGGVAATFPTPGSYVMFGTANSGAATTGPSNWHNTSTGQPIGSIHVMCATCIENSSESADGSWTVLMGILNQAVDAYCATSFMHMDGSEDGDLDPYACFVANSLASYSNTRTVNVSTFASSGVAPYLKASTLCTATTHMRGWRRRGFATADNYQDFSLGCLLNGTATLLSAPGNQQFPHKVANHPNPNNPIREPLYVVSIGPTAGPLKMRKGYFRWWFITQGGACNRLLLNGAYMQADTSSNTTGVGGSFVMGPWDGVSNPMNGYGF